EVVLPTPPFWLAMVNTRRAPGRGSLSSVRTAFFGSVALSRVIPPSVASSLHAPHPAARARAFHVKRRRRPDHRRKRRRYRPTGVLVVGGVPPPPGAPLIDPPSAPMTGTPRCTLCGHHRRGRL